ncbi:hypothetical protein OH491_01585 [Termitidicoccus mucosus]|uniref:Uncharacterized protein n=1 Tax=Termitidicoccus mucosus TaxID=1184151 RepID=A0A178IKL1_9BACT|nr:hypothetical protein AW736_07970 [Opitutaceae bacterium TSB47]
MAIKPKPNDNTVTLPPENEGPLQFRNNPEVQKRLDAYKVANAGDVEYYTRVVREAPERARDMLLYKDMQRHETDMRLIEKQLPQAKAFYNAQPQEVKSRIDQRLEGVQPYYKDKAFVGEVLREMNRQNRQMLTGPKPGMAMSAG